MNADDPTENHHPTLQLYKHFYLTDLVIQVIWTNKTKTMVEHTA